MNRYLPLLCVLILGLQMQAQLGGTQSYLTLDLPNSTRVSALGGRFISVLDDDLGMAITNPALLDSSDTRQLAMNYAALFSDVGMASASYAHHQSGIGTFSASLNYLGYGDFTERDEFNNELGTFNASDFYVQFGYGRQMDSLFRLGANLKFIQSQLANYSSSALAVDLAAAYLSKNKDFSMGLLVRNVGTQLGSFVEGAQEPLPFGIDLGMTKRLSKSPLRMTVTLSDLQQWDLSYTDPADIGQTDPLTGEPIPVEEADFATKALLHLNASMEFLLGKNFHLRAGYDFRRRNELALNDKPGGAGLSWGLGLKISKLHLSYGRVIFNQAGATNHIGLGLRWADFSKKAGAVGA